MMSHYSFGVVKGFMWSNFHIYSTKGFNSEQAIGLLKCGHLSLNFVLDFEVPNWQYIDIIESFEKSEECVFWQPSVFVKGRFDN